MMITHRCETCNDMVKGPMLHNRFCSAGCSPTRFREPNGPKITTSNNQSNIPTARQRARKLLAYIPARIQNELIVEITQLLDCAEYQIEKAEETAAMLEKENCACMVERDHAANFELAARIRARKYRSV